MPCWWSRVLKELQEQAEKAEFSYYVKKGAFPTSICSPKLSNLEITPLWLLSPCLAQCKLLQSLTQDLRITLMTLSAPMRNPLVPVLTITDLRVCSQHGWNLLLLQQMTSLQVIVERLLGIKGSYSKEIFILSSLRPVTLQQQAWSKHFTRICQQVYPRECCTASTGVQVCHVSTEALGFSFSEPVFEMQISKEAVDDRNIHDVTIEFTTTTWVTTARTRIWKNNRFRSE